jgi:hypothetical protein
MGNHRLNLGEVLGPMNNLTNLSSAPGNMAVGTVQSIRGNRRVFRDCHYEPRSSDPDYLYTRFASNVNDQFTQIDNTGQNSTRSYSPGNVMDIIIYENGNFAFESCSNLGPQIPIDEILNNSNTNINPNIQISQKDMQKIYNNSHIVDKVELFNMNKTSGPLSVVNEASLSSASGTDLSSNSSVNSTVNNSDISYIKCKRSNNGNVIQYKQSGSMISSYPDAQGAQQRATIVNNRIEPLF